MYAITKTLAGGYAKSKVLVKDRNREMPMGEELQREQMERAFEELLKKPVLTERPDILPDLEDLEIGCWCPTKENIK